MISARREKDSRCRRPLLVAFKIPDLYVSPPVLTFHSWAPYGYIFFKNVLKRHLRYNYFRRHYRLILQSKLRITPTSFPGSLILTPGAPGVKMRDPGNEVAHYPSPLKPNKIRTEYAQGHHLAGEWQAKLFPTRKKITKITKKPTKWNRNFDWVWQLSKDWNHELWRRAG